MNNSKQISNLKSYFEKELGRKLHDNEEDLFIWLSSRVKTAHGESELKQETIT